MDEHEVQMLRGSIADNIKVGKRPEQLIQVMLNAGYSDEEVMKVFTPFFEKPKDNKTMIAASVAVLALFIVGWSLFNLPSVYIGTPTANVAMGISGFEGLEVASAICSGDVLKLEVINGFDETVTGVDVLGGACMNSALQPGQHTTCFVDYDCKPQVYGEYISLSYNSQKHGGQTSNGYVPIN